MVGLMDVLKSPLAHLLVPVVCLVVFSQTDHDNRQVGILLTVSVATALAMIVPAALFAVYYYFCFSGAQTTKVEHKQYLDGLLADMLAGIQRASLCYMLYLLDAPLPICLVGFMHFLLPCVVKLVRFVTTAAMYVSEGPRAAIEKGSINVGLWQHVLRAIVSGGKLSGGGSHASSKSRYAQVNTGKDNSGAARKTSLRTSNVECRVVDEGKHFNRVARGCLLP